MMYEIKQIADEDVLIRYNKLKHEIDKALEHSDGEWTAAQIVQRVISEPTMFHIWEVSAICFYMRWHHTPKRIKLNM